LQGVLSAEPGHEVPGVGTQENGCGTGTPKIIDRRNNPKEPESRADRQHQHAIATTPHPEDQHHSKNDQPKSSGGFGLSL
jgi:hypothetical protein